MKNKITSIYKQTERFAGLTNRAIISGNIVRAKKLLNIAENLLETGSKETKEVIATVYVYSVSTFIEICHCSVSNLFPKALKAEYVKQINAISV